MGGVCASAGYMIAAACDKLFAMPASVVGSIGVVAGKLNLSNLAKDIGVNFEVIKSNELGGMFSLVSGFSGKEKQAFASVVDAQYERFIADVANRRRMTFDQVKAIAGGKVYLGDEALALGLVDAIGSYEDVKEAAKAELKLKENQDMRLVKVPRQQLRPWMFFSARPKNEEEKDKLYCLMESDVGMPLGSGGGIVSGFENAAELGRVAQQAQQWLSNARNGNASTMFFKHEYMGPGGISGDIGKRSFSTWSAARQAPCHRVLLLNALRKVM
jgi:ClpP class serine protease